MAATQTDFPRYERALWGVLARLARSGYVVPPAEGRDVIHDFFVDDWEGLQRRFDPAKGKFETYLIGAFYQFARRRILDLNNWRGRLVDVSHAAELAADAPGPEEQAEVRETIRTVREALSGLDPRQRAVLEDFLRGDKTGERDLAKRHGVSRYALRETLVDALGRVAAELGRIGGRDSLDGRIVAALWREGGTVRDVAARVGVSAAEVQAARRRCGLGLMNALRGGAVAETGRGTVMTKDPLGLLKLAILSADRKELLDEVRQGAKAILEALRSEIASLQKR